MNYIKDNGMMENCRFGSLAAKAAALKNTCLKMKTAAGRYCFIMYCRGLSWQ